MTQVKKCISNFIKNDFSKFDNIFYNLSKYDFWNKKILVAVSGGPDSMFLSVLIYAFFVKNNLDLDNLFFIHCNHKTRLETDLEQRFIEDFFKWLNISVAVYDENINKTKTENNLRKWRYQIFKNSIEKNKIDYLLTGHNLTDRIESTFMNLFRGCGLNGFESMKFEDKNNLLVDEKNINFKILRPLLSYTKVEIEWFCNDKNIQYVVDKTNFIQETSLRNKIRLSLFPKLAQYSNKNELKTNSFFESMKNIYFELDQLNNNDLWKFIKINRSPYRNSDFAFFWDIPLWFITQAILLKVL